MLRATASVGRRAPTVKGAIPATPTWRRALPVGVLPAYDEALKLITEDATRLRAEERALHAQIVEKAAQVKATAEGVERDGLVNELEEIRKLHRIVDVQSQVNIPKVRWSARHGYYRMQNAAHRHLREQQWREDGKLDLTMERIHQMNVVPDLLTSIRPSLDITLHTKPSQKSKRTYKSVVVEPGAFLDPAATVSYPSVTPTAFHTDTRLYTLVMVNPDFPDEENQTFQNYLHWLAPNIPIRAGSTGPLRKLNEHTFYVPPTPFEGMRYNRYALFLLQQPPKTEYSLNVEAEAKESGEVTSKTLDIPVFSREQRLGFDLRAFMKEWGFDSRQGGGVHMWRAVWDQHTDWIYQHFHGKAPPKYGIPRKEDPYVEVKRREKYVVA
ncbi:PEBP-like protein [Cylindrobasidium torrendii FP15055 ss-10]|uniref:PEBP-like protein n=1 Tax=Cylindrobasidium torrendii FP15055 ss-10 TaxID=1314674 RepID=A0A0D7B052_9AGAR|nr:PEBP-like protein [Cylindrobasidium torrendii FP15055 ss-10]